MPKYTFEWSKTTTYTTIIEADSEADANADLMNDITANQTDFASDITDEVFDVPEESIGVTFSNPIAMSDDEIKMVIEGNDNVIKGVFDKWNKDKKGDEGGNA